MITTVAELLQELMSKEREKLDAQKITHPPTIGAMYEGLARDILGRSIPSNLNVRVVEGFIEGIDGELSPQIDAMIVTGVGQPIPHTDSHVWPIADVIAVFEVKKSLYGADLKDGFVKLRVVKRMSEAYIQSGVLIKAGPSYRAFARLTGHYPKSVQEVDCLPDGLNYLFHTILADQVAPVRVMLGYHGYADEAGLRKGMLDYLTEQKGLAEGFGASSMPNLIVARRNALLKMDGHPYISPLTDGWWHLLVSSPENPLRILIELLWAKLGDRFGGVFPVDDNLELERLAPLLDARLMTKDGRTGWAYNHVDFSAADLAAAEPPQWKPEETDVAEMVIQLQVAPHGVLDVRDQKFREFAAEEGLDADAVIARMVDRRVLAWVDDHTVRLVEGGVMLTGFMPDGKGYTTSEPELLGSWVRKELFDR
jgi:hypothetical protein